MHRGSEQGFTLVELVIVIAIIGILAAIAIPRFIDIRNEAYRAQRDGIISSVRSGILLVASRNQVAAVADQGAGNFPPNLEAGWGNANPGGSQPGSFASPCNTNACFELVVPGGLSEATWSQTAALEYTFTAPVGNSSQTCTYSATNGTLTCS